ncbi:hypothetical protein SAMN04489844_2428 [Nocardioides exalbidus]|uniref:Lipoprotein LpqN n=1 Tax=Nocardioides exalbidus TaxID=402596 RepID=A0A1H4T3T2_9ACTN|nr:hypothetical protein [Nocardioides exalbidus]SEC50970.1 hypothetical protein SAMN04489844_2428 [Nocardioides exalbidus]
MTSQRPRSTRLAVSACLAVLLAATGCQSSADDPADEPSSGSEATSSAPPSPVPTSTTPTVEPADGKLIKVPGATMRALSTYKRYADYGILQGYSDRRTAVSFSPDLSAPASLDAFAKEFVADHGGKKVAQRQDDVVIGGGKYNAWHVLDTSATQGDEIHYYGVMFLNGAWLIRITRVGNPKVPLSDEEFQGVMDSLLATFTPDVG